MPHGADEYYIIAGPGRVELREKASRFFGFADLVQDQEAAAEIRARLKKQFHDADHQPFAWQLKGGQVRFSDDGEPKGTAGSSILAQIRGAELYQVQVVIVRYFGGTKLGKGGLVRAFGECARLALENAGRSLTRDVGYLELCCSPAEVSGIKALAAPFGAEVAAISYAANARLRLALPAHRLEECRRALGQRFGQTIFDLQD